MAQANKDLFNVTNKFGFLVVSDSDDEDAAWEKPKKTAKLRSLNFNSRLRDFGPNDLDQISF